MKTPNQPNKMTAENTLNSTTLGGPAWQVDKQKKKKRTCKRVIKKTTGRRPYFNSREIQIL